MPAPRIPGHVASRCPMCKIRHNNRQRFGDPIGHTPPGNPRLPWEPIAHHIDTVAGRPLTNKDQAEFIGEDPAQVFRWRQTGLRFHDADRVAVRLGLHPYDLWGDAYFAVGFHVCPIANADELNEEIAA